MHNALMFNPPLTMLHDAMETNETEPMEVRQNIAISACS